MNLTDYSAALVAEATDALYRGLDFATQRTGHLVDRRSNHGSRVRALHADLLRAEQLERDETMECLTSELSFASVLVSLIERQLAALDAPGTSQKETVQMLEFMQDSVESRVRHLLDELAAIAIDQGRADALAADGDF